MRCQPTTKEVFAAQRLEASFLHALADIVLGRKVLDLSGPQLRCYNPKSDESEPPKQVQTVPLRPCAPPASEGASMWRRIAVHGGGSVATTSSVASLLLPPWTLTRCCGVVVHL